MTWTVAGIDFAHFHMGDNLRMVADHPDAELVAIADEHPETATLGLAETAEEFGLDDDQVYRDHCECLERANPDVVVTCPTPADHADRVEQLAPYGVHVLLEKPMATSVADADRIRSAMEGGGTLAVNWPLAWYPPHRTTKRLIAEGRIGDVVEVHYYDGNRGGQRFTAVEYTDGELHFLGDLEGGGPAVNVTGETPGEEAWWHRPEAGGGSLVDYLGYGTTLGTWFRDGDLPESVTAETFVPEGMAVDTHCVAVARYETGLSRFESRWGTFTDPWVDQPQPECGFVVVGTEGTIASHDYEESVRVQDESEPGGYEVPVDELEAPRRDPVEYLLHCVETDAPVGFGPLDPDLCRAAQRIVDAAAESAARGERVSLEESA